MGRGVATGWTCLLPHSSQRLYLRLVQSGEFFRRRWGQGIGHVGTRLACVQNAENEANLLFPLVIRNLKGFNTEGLSWTPLGPLRSSPQPRYRLALRAFHVCSPSIF